MATGSRPAVTYCAAVLLAAALLISAPDATGSARSPLQSPPSSYSLLFCSCSGTFPLRVGQCSHVCFGTVGGGADSSSSGSVA